MAQSCPAKCSNGDRLEMVYPKSGAYTCPAGDWQCVAREIHTYGSVAGAYTRPLLSSTSAVSDTTIHPKHPKHPKHPLTPPNTPLTRATQPLRAPPIA